MQTNMIISRLAIGAASVGMALGCGKSDVATKTSEATTDGEAADGGAGDGLADSGTEPHSIKDLPHAVLPRTGSDASCETSRPPLSACDWALQSDAVVLGEIIALTFVDGPYVYTDSTMPSGAVESCNGLNEGGDRPLALTLEVHEWLTGSGASEVTIRLGKAHSDLWNPSPNYDSAAKSLIWVGDSMPEAPLAVGSVAIFSFSVHSGSGARSMLGVDPVAIGAEWTVEFPKRPCETGPVVPSATSYEDFVEMLSSCTPTELSQSWHASRQEQAPQWVNAGYCAVPDTASGCQIGSDCDSGVCNNGTCAEL